MAQKRQNKKNDVGNLTFEEAIGNLTEIVDKIETGQVPLQESLQQYEKGMAMIKHCRSILLDAEKRIEQIAENEEEEEIDEDEQEPSKVDDSEDDVLF